MRESRVEASMPTQSRIDVRRMAEMDCYFIGQGVYSRTISQLVSLTMELCCKILKDNELMKKEYELVEDAHGYLSMRGLGQVRWNRKMATTKAYEDLRIQGIDPSSVNTRRYKQMHNDRSVSPPSFEIATELNDTAKALLKELNERKSRELKKEAHSRLEYDENNVVILPGERRSGGITEEDLSAEDLERFAAGKKQDVIDAIKTRASKPKERKEDDRPRPKTAEELDAEEERIREKDRQYAEALKGM